MNDESGKENILENIYDKGILHKMGERIKSKSIIGNKREQVTNEVDYQEGA